MNVKIINCVIRTLEGNDIPVQIGITDDLFEDLEKFPLDDTIYGYLTHKEFLDLKIGDKIFDDDTIVTIYD